MRRTRRHLARVVPGLVATIMIAPLLHAAPASARPAADSSDYVPLADPVYTGSANPVPALPASFRADGMMQAVYDADLAHGDGTSFWMDRLLERRGPEPSNSVDVLMSRGRAAFMRSYDPASVGLGGQLAYYDALGSSADAVDVDLGATFTEQPDQRVQSPSHWTGVYVGADGVTARVTKFFTQNNVYVERLVLSASKNVTVPVTVDSPLATNQQGDELTGQLAAYNNLTTVYPRLSGDRMTVDGGKLVRQVNLQPGRSVSLKLQLGLITRELTQSRAEYDSYRAMSAQAAYVDQVRTYNKWWAQNIPYIDVPDQNLKKAIYYRWWILRFNYLDADMPGNDYQMPTSIEGVLGYNNAIALTVPMFSQDLKYLRDPSYSYGPWLSAGEAAAGDVYVDNPGDPANWSNSYAQYITQSALQSWQIHGGPKSIMAKLASYGEGDARGQLAKYDPTNENLLTYCCNFLTGNDADAASFDYRPGAPLQRPETAYVYENAMAAATAYRQAGNPAKAAEMTELAAKVKTAMLTKMWDPDTKQFKSRFPSDGTLDPWREINNYLPFTAGLVPDTADYKKAFRLWDDPSQFSIFPMYTANQADKAAAAAAGRPGSNNFSHINSVIQFNFLASALRHYPSKYLSAATLRDSIQWAGWANFANGDNRYPDSNEFWSDWNPKTKQIDYRSFIHQTQLGATNYPIIEDVAGLQTRSDRKIEVWPIDIGYDHFAVTDLDYRGSNLSIVWDKEGGHYGDLPRGYSLIVDGKVVATSDKLTRLVYDPSTGSVKAGDGATVTNTQPSDVAAPGGRAITDTRTVDTLQKAGIDVSATTGGTVNRAAQATVTASHSDTGHPADAVTDGNTWVRPYWSDHGSGSGQDWLRFDFDRPTSLDDAKIYFYDDQPQPGFAAPEQYSVEYLDGDTWKPVPRQSKTPQLPTAAYNHVQFRTTTASSFRLAVTNPSGSAVGVREVQLFRTGVRGPAPTNAAPVVTASTANHTVPIANVPLTGTVADDGLPTGSLTVTWTKVSGPGDVVFADPSATSTTASFSAPGDYVLRLTGSDGAASSSADVAVSVVASGHGPNLAPQASTSASYTSPWENLSAINTGTDPTSSNPGGAGKAWGTWPNAGVQWAQLTWPKPVRLSGAAAYFYDDKGGIPLPDSWKVQYWTGTAWADVDDPSSYPIADDTYNAVTFTPVTTTQLRYVLDGGTPADGTQRGVGLRQVRAYAQEPEQIVAPQVPTDQGQQPDLPATVDAVYADGSRLALPVTWSAFDPSAVDAGGTSFAVNGLVTGSDQIVTATVWVRVNPSVQITSLAPVSVTTSAGVAPTLPETVTATYNDGSKDNVTTMVAWADVAATQYAQPGTFTVSGTVAGTTLPAKATVTVT